MPQRFFAGRETLTASLLANRCRDMDYSSINAAPTEVCTIPERFFSGAIALTLFLPALCRCRLDNFPVDATPTSF
jgi:hypothetical protein